MLAVLRRSGLQTSIVTLCVAISIALFIPSLRLSPVPLLIALVSGFSTSLTVLSVLFPALLLYQLQQTRNGMSVLAQAIVRLCPDKDLLMLLMVLGLAPFIECFSGFGVGTVVVVPIFVAIGADPLQAALLGLLGQIAVPWGGLAVGITLGAQLTHLDPNMLGAYTALIAAPLPVVFGLFALKISGGRATLTRRWYAACIAGLVLAAGEWFFSLTTSVELAGALASLVCLVLLALWSYAFARKTRTATREDTTPENATSENKDVTQHDNHSSKPPLGRVIAPTVYTFVCGTTAVSPGSSHSLLASDPRCTGLTSYCPSFASVVYTRILCATCSLCCNTTAFYQRARSAEDHRTYMESIPSWCNCDFMFFGDEPGNASKRYDRSTRNGSRNTWYQLWLDCSLARGIRWLANWL